MHGSHAVSRARGDRAQCGSSEDEDAREPDADEHERGTRGREHSFEWERDRGAHVATRVLELVERCAPGVGAERQLEQPRRGDREQREPQAQAQSLRRRPSSDERDADDGERDRDREAHPADQHPGDLPQRAADDPRPVRVDPQPCEHCDDDASETGQVALVPVDRLAPARAARDERPPSSSSTSLLSAGV